MTGKSSDCRDKSGKNKTLALDTPVSRVMFDQEDLLLKTRHQNLIEDHENLKQDYASLKQRFKLVEEMNQMMKPRLQNQNQTKEDEARNLRLLKELESERNEKCEYKKMVEEMKRVESESKATIDELRIKNEELLIVLEKEEEENKKKETKYDELAKRCAEIAMECLYWKSIYDAKNLTGQGRNDVALDDEVVVVGENYNVNNNTVADAIIISDESDAEYDNPPRESNIIPPRLLVVIKKEEQQCSNGANSSQVNHPSSKVKQPIPSSKVKHPSWSSSSSSSSSSDECLVPLKRSRDDYNKKF